MSRSSPGLRPGCATARTKPVWERAFTARRTLASGLLFLWAILAAGCVLGQEDDMELPPLTNQPVRIIEQQATWNGQASRFFVWANRGSGCTLEFQVPVEDPDVSDQLMARWYVDDHLAPTLPIPIWEEILANQGGAEQRLAKYEVNTSSAGNPLMTPGQHVLTLLVTDARTARPGETPAPEPVPGYDGGQPRYVDTLQWVITIENGCCPGSLPSPECPQ